MAGTSKVPVAKKNLFMPAIRCEYAAEENNLQLSSPGDAAATRTIGKDRCT
ncbi:MAG: hypothetical protein RQ723_11945 [Desulfuromonadales bacterium]|nr:hypothetical protein [Desulfuromonadales bacterium]